MKPNDVNCGEMKAWFDALAENRPEALARPELEEHLVECGDCCEEVESRRDVVRLLRRAAVAREVGAVPRPGPDASAAERAAYSAYRMRETIAMVERAAVQGADEGAAADGIDAGDGSDTGNANDGGGHTNERALRMPTFAVVGLAAAAVVAAGMLVWGGGDRRVAPPSAERLAEGRVRIEVPAGGRMELQLPGMRLEVSAPATLDARLWSSAALLAAAEPELAVRVPSGDGPVLDVATIAGTAVVSTSRGMARLEPGERALVRNGAAPRLVTADAPSPIPSDNSAAASRRESAAPDPNKNAPDPNKKTASLLGRVEAPADAGVVTVEIYDFLAVERAARDGARDLPGPARRIAVGATGAFAIDDLVTGLWAVVPVSSGPTVPTNGHIIAFGEEAKARLAEARAGGAPVDASLLEAGGMHTIVLRLLAAGTVRGVVRDAAGAPVANARIRVEPRAAGSPISPRGERATTASDGSFECVGIVGKFAVAVSTDDGRGGYAEGSVEAGALASVELTVAPWRAPAGRVVTRAGAPVAGARIRASRSGEPNYLSRGLPLTFGEATTGADGAFHFAAPVEADEWVLIADAEGFARGVSATFHSGADTGRAIEIVLDPARTLEVRVADAAGAPVAGAVLTLAAVRRPGEATPTLPDELTARATSDASGVARFLGVAEGEYQLSARAAGFRAAGRRVNVAAGSERLELTLERGARVVRGRVRLRGAAPSSGIVASSALHVDARTDVDLWRFASDPRALPAGTDPLAVAAPVVWNRTGGTFESTLPEGVHSAWIALVVAGRVEDATLATDADDIELTADLAAIERAAGALALTVRDAATGAAIADATVRFADSGGARLGLVRRDAGRLVFGPLRSGVYDVTVSAPGYSPGTRTQVVVTARRTADLSVALELEKR